MNIESLSPKQKLITSFWILCVFVVFISLLFAAAKGAANSDIAFFRIFRKIGYHSSWIVLLLLLCDLLILKWIAFPSFFPKQPLSFPCFIHVSLLAGIFLLTFFPLGNWLKYNMLFFENWMWYCILWIFGLSLSYVVSNYIALYHPNVLERIGHLFAAFEKKLTTPLSPRLEILFLFCFCMWVCGFTLFVNLFVLGGIPHVQDSIAQWFQAKIFAHGQLAFPAPEDSHFFERIYVVVTDNRWYTIYPPGHALVLSLGVLLGLPQLINPLVSAAILPLFYLFARKTFSLYVARLGVILLSLSPFFLLMGSGFMNHPTSLFFLLLFLLFLLQCSKENSWRKHLLWSLGAGFFFAMAFITRPMTSLAFLIAGIGWYKINQPERKKFWFRTGMGFLIGTILPAAFYLYYNEQTTGSPFLTGYVKYFNGNPLGFGKRPWGPEPLGPKIPNEVYHSPVRGIANIICNLNGLNYHLFGWPVPSLLFAFVPFLPWRKIQAVYWHCVFSILLVFLIYFFYFFQDYCYGPRFLYETIPFWILLSAQGIKNTKEYFEESPFLNVVRSRGLVYSLITLFFILAACTVWVERFVEMGNAYWGTRDELATMAKEKIEEENAIIFVEDGDDFVALFPFLDPDLDAGWIVAHDYGWEENQKLLNKYPDWPVYYLRLKETDHPAIFDSVLETYNKPE